MGLFDKIKDNAKNISMRALDDAEGDYDERNGFVYKEDQKLATEAATLGSSSAIITPETTVTEDVTTESETEVKEEPKAKPEPKTENKEENEVKTSRKSKVTEISKEEHEKAEKEKRQKKAKQEAKERLAKSYVPSYKTTPSSSSKTTKKTPVKPSTTAKDAAKAVTTKLTVRPKKSVGIVDVTPNKFQAPAVGAGFARERAALTVLASQRKLNGAVPLYTATHMNFKTKVFINRIEYSGSFGKNVIPIEHVAWVKLRYGGTGVIVETTENKRIVMVVKQSDRLAFTDAILKVQALQPKRKKFRDTKTVRIDELEKFSEGVDEIEKLAKLYDKGILSQEEFDAKKRQILGL